MRGSSDRSGTRGVSRAAVLVVFVLAAASPGAATPLDGAEEGVGVRAGNVCAPAAMIMGIARAPAGVLAEAFEEERIEGERVGELVCGGLVLQIWRGTYRAAVAPTLDSLASCASVWTVSRSSCAEVPSTRFGRVEMSGYVGVTSALLEKDGVTSHIEYVFGTLGPGGADLATIRLSA